MVWFLLLFVCILVMLAASDHRVSATLDKFSTTQPHPQPLGSPLWEGDTRTTFLRAGRSRHQKCFVEKEVHGKATCTRAFNTETVWKVFCTAWWVLFIDKVLCLKAGQLCALKLVCLGWISCVFFRNYLYCIYTVKELSRAVWLYSTLRFHVCVPFSHSLTIQQTFVGKRNIIKPLAWAVAPIVTWNVFGAQKPRG